MKYVDTIDYEKMKRVEEEREYLQAIQILIEDVRYNYNRMPNDENLTHLYNSISYLGNDNGLMPETEKRILKMARLKREQFIELFNTI